MPQTPDSSPDRLVIIDEISFVMPTLNPNDPEDRELHDTFHIQGKFGKTDAPEDQDRSLNPE